MTLKYDVALIMKTVLGCAIIATAQASHAENDGAPPIEESGKAWITSGFLSHHFNRDAHYNEENTGLGFEYEFDPAHAIAFGHYRNSVRAPSNYLQFVYTPFTLGVFRAGAALGLLNGYPLLRGGRYSPVLVPTVLSDFKLLGHDVGINIMYIPTIAPRVDGAIALQFKLRFK